MRRALSFGAAVLAASTTGSSAVGAHEPLRVRATPELSACGASLVSAYGSPGAVVLEIGDARDVAGFDVVIGGGRELVRALESGRADERRAVRLGGLPGPVPFTGTAAPVAGSPRAKDADAFLRFLAGDAARRAFQACGGTPEAAAAQAPADTRYAIAFVDWWVPACSLQHNQSSRPVETVGRPNARNRGPDSYTGMMSLGQGGWVVVDMGRPVVDRPGADVRIYQTTSEEPVTLYASDSPSGPFRLVQLMRPCGIPSPGVFSNHCDFDLAAAGIASARYFRVEDGEIWPCTSGDTVTEGADIDAVAALAP
jgi:hypothetical protein